MNSATDNELVVWEYAPLAWISGVIVCALLGFVYYDGIKDLVRIWNSREEYSYGYLIPFVTFFLIWQRKDKLEAIPFTGSWVGIVIAFLGFMLLVIGNLSTIYLIVQYSLLIVIAGLALALTGWQGFQMIRIPLLIMLFMIPFPPFFLTEISAQLQLVSSQIGVWIIRLIGISVFLEGNVIDLGTFKLQVVEACSGLRYLFPLLTLGFLSAYFFKQAFWKRAVLFLSAVPITILMNSFRIGVIGVLVEYYGKSMAEGFLHDFEGWAVFMACTAILVCEMWLLSKIGTDRRPLREVFGMELPAPTPRDAEVKRRSLPAPYLGVVILLIITAAVDAALPQRNEISPQRHAFSEFPMSLGNLHGKRDRLEQIYIDALKFDDYMLADYVAEDQQPINFYVAYYASQRKGESTHSPRTCIPGGGWEIKSLTQRKLDGAVINGRVFTVNRAVIQKGEYRQLVYYWFQQRGRDLTNEYLVKWYIFWDALTRNRTDGALVRLITPISPGENSSEGDKRLTSFAKFAIPELRAYVPD